MIKMIFRNGTGMPHLPPDHLNLIELRPWEDELEAVQRYMSGDPTLNNYLGLADIPDVFLRKRSITLPGSTLQVSCRNCWRWVAGAIVVDMTEYRGEYLKTLRLERDSRLDASDKISARLEDLGTPAQIAAHKAYRQALRDLPATVQADLAGIGTANGLENYVPPWPVT